MSNNPMPDEIYRYMLRFLPGGSGKFDLHHCLIDKGDVRGMPLEIRKMIHHPYNLWWVSSQDHASHARIEDKRYYYKALCKRWGKFEIDEYIKSFQWKSNPPVTVEWLESSEDESYNSHGVNFHYSGSC